MKIDFDGVQAFVVVADLGGFNRAASELHISQTALTRRIQKLESYLGLKLLAVRIRTCQELRAMTTRTSPCTSWSLEASAKAPLRVGNTESMTSHVSRFWIDATSAAPCVMPCGGTERIGALAQGRKGAKAPCVQVAPGTNGK